MSSAFFKVRFSFEESLKFTYPIEGKSHQLLLIKDAITETRQSMSFLIISFWGFSQLKLKEILNWGSNCAGKTSSTSESAWDALVKKGPKYSSCESHPDSPRTSTKRLLNISISPSEFGKTGGASIIVERSK